MKKYVCAVCGYIYDEALGIPQAGIMPGTRWSDLPDDWVCPLCGANKSEFKLVDTSAREESEHKTYTIENTDDMKELTSLEISVICSNLARGCEKQYKDDEATQFKQLADFFKASSPKPKNADYEALLSLIENDLNENIPRANEAAKADRGALRALVWNEKVTRILKSLLTRYQQEGEKMLENTSVYVCTICGFIYIGDTPPQLCPICKVPSWKFTQVEVLDR